jgi:tricorn protease-like protein
MVGEVTDTWIAPTSGGAPVRVVEPLLQAWMPDWSPDGRWLAIAAIEEGTIYISKQRVGSGDRPKMLRQVMTPWACLLAWSPDGRWIAHDSPEGLALVAAEGTTHRVLTPGTRLHAIAWTADSRTIYGLASLEPQGARVVAIDVATGGARTIRSLPANLRLETAATPGLRMTLNREGTRLLTTGLRSRSDIWMLEGFESE